MMNWERRKRLEILTLLGAKCVSCGCTDVRCLQIEHVDDDGYAERKSCRNMHDYYKLILSKIKAGSTHYQCMCANCNQIKKWLK